MIIKYATTTGRSRRWIESMMSLPIPGQAKTVSVTTEKAINPPSSKPRTVTTGIMMFFRRWTMISLDSLSPLALANFM